jgi:branched-subunit amino acid transport protein AzlD
MSNLPVSFWRSVVIILLVAVTTFATRAIPFILFPEGKEIPKAVQYLGKVLPPAVIGMLVVYCFKSMNITSAPFGLPEIIAGIVVALLHVWKRNNLLSIGTGTILYMVLVQYVFV